jgi:hypothetical protein
MAGGESRTVLPRTKQDGLGATIKASHWLLPKGGVITSYRLEGPDS